MHRAKRANQRHSTQQCSAMASRRELPRSRPNACFERAFAHGARPHAMADRGRGEAILFYHPDTRHKVAVVTAALFCCSRCDTTQATSQVRHPVRINAHPP
ncbi:hypothetical protein KCP77_02805 [Salmonella enterica subsp. enterica]|nr:hypothetical protein KCP77_02805 [Salmonella enterica subsp. enterica]